MSLGFILVVIIAVIIIIGWEEWSDIKLQQKHDRDLQNKYFLGPLLALAAWSMKINEEIVGDQKLISFRAEIAPHMSSLNIIEMENEAALIASEILKEQPKDLKDFFTQLAKLTHSVEK